MLILALGMSMDAFAAALARGTCLSKELSLLKLLKTGLVFGGIEMLAPLLGYLIGSAARQWVSQWDHWLAFALLSILGLRMMFESLKNDDKNQINAPCEERHSEKNIAPKQDKGMLVLTAFATSIDSLVVGVGLAFLNVNIVLAALCIGLSTTLMATLGLYLGRILGNHIGRWAELFGGLVLVMIGAWVLMEHLSA